MLDVLIHFLMGLLFPEPQFMADGTPILMGWILPAIAGVSALGNLISGSRSQARADRANRRALQLAESRYRETRPFRLAALSSLRGELQGPNLDNVFGGNTGNPFDRPIRPVPGPPSDPRNSYTPGTPGDPNYRPRGY